MAERTSELEDRSEENIRIYIFFRETKRIKNTGKELTKQIGYDEKDLESEKERREVMEQKRYTSFFLFCFPKQTKNSNTLKKHYKFQSG